MNIKNIWFRFFFICLFVCLGNFCNTVDTLYKPEVTNRKLVVPFISKQLGRVFWERTKSSHDTRENQLLQSTVFTSSRKFLPDLKKHSTVGSNNQVNICAVHYLTNNLPLSAWTVVCWSPTHLSLLSPLRALGDKQVLHKTDMIILSFM